MKKIELEGYLYLRNNEYDMYGIEEAYLDEDISEIFYENLDKASYHLSGLDPNHPYYKKYREEAKRNIKQGKLLVDLIREKLEIEPGVEKFDFKGRGDYTITFMPDYRKVRIKIEEVE